MMDNTNQSTEGTIDRIPGMKNFCNITIENNNIGAFLVTFGIFASYTTVKIIFAKHLCTIFLFISFHKNPFPFWRPAWH